MVILLYIHLPIIFATGQFYLISLHYIEFESSFIAHVSFVKVH